MCLFSAPSKPYTNHTLSLVRPVNPTVGRVLPLSFSRFHSCSCPFSHLRCCPCFRSRSRRRLCSRPSLVPPLPSALPISVPVPVTVFAPSPSPSLFPFAPSRHASDLVPPSRYNARARAPGVGNGLLAACKRQRLSAEMMSRADREKAPIVKHNKNRRRRRATSVLSARCRESGECISKRCSHTESVTCRRPPLLSIHPLSMMIAA